MHGSYKELVSSLGIGDSVRGISGTEGWPVGGFEPQSRIVRARVAKAHEGRALIVGMHMNSSRERAGAALLLQVERTNEAIVNLGLRIVHIRTKTHELVLRRL